MSAEPLFNVVYRKNGRVIATDYTRARGEAAKQNHVDGEDFELVPVAAVEVVQAEKPEPTPTEVKPAPEIRVKRSPVPGAAARVWRAWHAVKKGDRVAKIPCDRDGKNLAAYQEPPFETRPEGKGGIILNEHSPYRALDGDAFTTQDGNFHGRAAAVVQMAREMNVYTEWSPSQKGLHFVGRGSSESFELSFKNDPKGDCHPLPGPFITVTGDVLIAGDPEGDIDPFLARVRQEFQAGATKPGPYKVRASATRAAIIEAAKRLSVYRSDDPKGVHLVCPWAAGHTGSGKADDQRDSTVLMDGDHAAGFKCFHGSCAGRTLRDALDYFGLQASRRLTVTTAADIVPRRVRWAWRDRIPLGGLSLIAGRESSGKSSVAYERAARVTRGQLEGDLQGKPRGVIVVATEDSWEHTIVPRLMAAGADMRRVFRVQAEAIEASSLEISLPDDIPAFERIIEEREVALIILDPVISRLGKLDTHKDAEVRQALEPLVGLGVRSGATVLGIIHLNKTATNDPLTAIMGSRAFAAVARAVLFVAREDSGRILCFPKSNLGPEAKSQTFRIDSTVVGEDPDDRQPIKAGVVVWGAEVNKTAREVLEDQSRANTAGPRKDAKAWLSARLEDGPVDSSVLKDEAEDAGIAPATLGRAMRALGCVVRSGGFPRKTSWALPHPLLSVCEATEGTDATEATGTTDASAVVSVASRQGTMPL